jgi:hypothetical protein
MRTLHDLDCTSPPSVQVLGPSCFCCPSPPCTHGWTSAKPAGAGGSSRFPCTLSATTSTGESRRVVPEGVKPVRADRSPGPRDVAAQDFYMRYRSSLTQLLADVAGVALKGVEVEVLVRVDGPPTVGGHDPGARWSQITEEQDDCASSENQLVAGPEGRPRDVKRSRAVVGRVRDREDKWTRQNCGPIRQRCAYQLAITARSRNNNSCDCSSRKSASPNGTSRSACA